MEFEGIKEEGFDLPGPFVRSEKQRVLVDSQYKLGFAEGKLVGEAGA